VVGAEALARFSDERGNRMPTEETFLDAHALGLGVELELAVVELALRNQERLPEGMYLALNVSPALLASGDLETLIAHGHHDDRPLVVELTEHQAVEDYGELGEALGRLRLHGVRVAVDDVGSGFASFRHVTRVNPEILKLDRSLVCGIDEDPVRQSLASAIVAFARDVGAIVVSEGIESENELSCLMGLAVGCGQGFYLARPGLGRVEPRVLELAS
jgi:EAL domain-containing protein (putative c-di-GMP-specific phosphodiesterase class I)